MCCKLSTACCTFYIHVHVLFLVSWYENIECTYPAAAGGNNLGARMRLHGVWWHHLIMWKRRPVKFILIATYLNRSYRKIPLRIQNETCYATRRNIKQSEGHWLVALEILHGQRWHFVVQEVSSKLTVQLWYIQVRSYMYSTCSLTGKYQLNNKLLDKLSNIRSFVVNYNKLHLMKGIKHYMYVRT